MKKYFFGILIGTSILTGASFERTAFAAASASYDQFIFGYVENRVRFWDHASSGSLIVTERDGGGGVQVLSQNTLSLSDMKKLKAEVTSWGQTFPPFVVDLFFNDPEKAKSLSFKYGSIHLESYKFRIEDFRKFMTELAENKACVAAVRKYTSNPAVLDLTKTVETIERDGTKSYPQAHFFYRNEVFKACAPLNSRIDFSRGDGATSSAASDLNGARSEVKLAQ